MICGYRNGTSSIVCQDKNLGCNDRCWQHCEFALQEQSQQKALFQGGKPSWQIDELFKASLERMLEHAIEFHNAPDTRCKTTPNGKYKGRFAFTLTMSPSDGLTEDDMIYACKKIMEQKSQPVKKFAWYLEYKDEETKSHPHIHGMYETETGRRIERKHWQRQWKIWDETKPLGQGFRGGYHRPVRHDEAYNDYISKQAGISESHV